MGRVWLMGRIPTAQTLGYERPEERNIRKKPSSTRHGVEKEDKFVLA